MFRIEFSLAACGRTVLSLQLLIERNTAEQAVFSSLQLMQRLRK
jgi:hypothetical protein